MDVHEQAQLLLGVEQAARLLGLGRSKVYQLLRARELSSISVGKRRLVPRYCLDEFIARRLAEAT